MVDLSIVFCMFTRGYPYLLDGWEWKILKKNGWWLGWPPFCWTPPTWHQLNIHKKIHPPTWQFTECPGCLPKLSTPPGPSSASCAKRLSCTSSGVRPPASAKVWSCGALLWPTASNTSRSRPCRPCARLARLLKTWSLAEKNGHLDKNMWDKQKMASFHRLDFELVVKVANQRGRSLNMPQEKSLKGLPIQPELKIGIFLFCQSHICIL